MAQYSVATGSVEARKLWSPQLDAATIPRTIISKFFGESQENIVQVHNDLERESGDRIRTFIRDVPARVAPFVDGENKEGNESTIETAYFDFTIDKFDFVNRVPNKTMSAQRVPYDLRAQAKAQHADYWRRHLDMVAFYHLCGYTPANYANRAGTGATSTVWNSGNTIADYVSSRSVFPTGETAGDDGLDSTGDNFTLDLVRDAVFIAKTIQPRIRTVSVPGFGDDKFVVFLHPDQVFDLKNSDTEWGTINDSLLQGGYIQNNPLITGSIGAAEGCVFIESEYVTRGVNDSTGVPVANTRRAVLAGAQALSAAFGRWHDSFSRFDWVEKTFNYGDDWGVCSKVMFGIARTVFTGDGTTVDGIDYGSVLIHTYTTKNSTPVGE